MREGQSGFMHATTRRTLDELSELLERQAGRTRDPVERLRLLRRGLRQAQARGAPRRARTRTLLASMALLLLVSAPTGSSSRLPSPLSRPSPSAPASGALPRLWLVEKTAEHELYSNGLRVERLLATRAGPRRPRRLALHGAPAGPPPDPAGIVFHASESDPAPLEPEWNHVLRRQGASLLQWVREHALYHYVVDRFGRVHRILEDDQRANHAGHSLWADANWIYLELNESFLGVCFEASTTDPARSGLSAAQLRSGRLLVEMLRAVHRLPAGNCVTHAQVSVNPRNGRIGYHTDWAAGFPFADLGLPDNYAQLLPALRFFGFEADSGFLARAGEPLRAAVEATLQELAEQARGGGLPLEQLRRGLQDRYRAAARAFDDLQE